MELDGSLSGWAQVHYRGKKWQVLAARSATFDANFHAANRLYAAYSPFSWGQIRGGLVQAEEHYAFNLCTYTCAAVLTSTGFLAQ